MRHQPGPLHKTRALHRCDIKGLPCEYRKPPGESRPRDNGEDMVPKTVASLNPHVSETEEAIARPLEPVAVFGDDDIGPESGAVDRPDHSS